MTVPVYYSNSPFEYISTHLHLIGWPTLVYAVWKVTTFLTDVKGRAQRAEDQLTMHIPATLKDVKGSIDNMADRILESDKETRGVIRDNFNRSV